MKRIKTTKKTIAQTEPRPVTTAQPVTSKPETTAPPATTIEATIDVGFGNNLFLRGQGSGLSWDRGTPLICVGPKTWRWSANVADTLTFKLLLNDRNWAAGDNLVVKPGARVEISPRF